MAQPKVFVSHSSNDSAFAERLVKDLRAAGSDAWLDKTDLGAGAFQQRINPAPSACEWFVLILTRSALASPWAQQEVDAANALKLGGQLRDLIFIQAEPLEPRDLPALWQVYNIFDGTANYATLLDRVVEAVELPPLRFWIVLAEGPKVHICPQHTDTDFAATFASQLRAHGADVWTTSDLWNSAQLGSYFEIMPVLVRRWE